MVRDALLHLYDVTYLQTHALGRGLKVTAGDDASFRGKRLLQVLLDAIESLRPVIGAPADSRAWRSYHLLELRYIRGLTVDEAIARLAISKTQYWRDHARALEAVASLLRDRLQLGSPGSGPAARPTSLESLALAEVDDLTTQMKPEYVQLADLLTAVLALLGSAAAENDVKLALSTPADLSPTYGDRVALRQVFLGLLNLAIEQADIGAVTVSVVDVDSTITVTIHAPRRANVSVNSGVAEDASLELSVARRLVAALGGHLTVEASSHDEGWTASVSLPVSLPVARRPVVLVVDNHPDFISLIGRYLAEYDWQVIGAQDVEQARALARERQPSVVLLDVMIPGQDGWDLLLGLKSEPETARIPVIICSILHEPQVARALGAAGYLRKPVSQSALLAALGPSRPGRPEPDPATAR